MTAVIQHKRSALRSGSKRVKSSAARGASRPRSPSRSSSADSRRALVQSLRGSLSWVGYSVDQYLAEKYADTERENRS